MEFKRHGEEEEEEEGEELELEEKGYNYNTCSSSMVEPTFSRPLLPPNSSLIFPSPRILGDVRREEHKHHHRHQNQQPSNGAEQQVVMGGARTSPSSTSGEGGGRICGTKHDVVSSAATATAAEAWRYRECLRNHAARLGAHVLDGCGEYMPSEGGGGGALACAACGCHRSFHRREAAVIARTAPVPAPAASSGNISGHGRLVPLLLPPPHMHKRPVPPAAANFQGSAAGAAASAAATESSSEEPRPSATPMPAVTAADTPTKKRFRTKFTSEQKHRMREFAHRIGWRIQKPDGSAVDEFCAQVGVSRRVLKVWMHNNKHLARNPNQEQQQQNLQHQEQQT